MVTTETRAFNSAAAGSPRYACLCSSGSESRVARLTQTILETFVDLTAGLRNDVFITEFDNFHSRRIVLILRHLQTSFPPVIMQCDF